LQDILSEGNKMTDNRRPSKKRSVEGDCTAEQVHSTERSSSRALSYQQIYQSGIDHRQMSSLVPQHVQELLRRVADPGNPFVGGSSHGRAETSTGFATSYGGPMQDVDLMEGFQLHQQQARLRQHDEAPVVHHPNEQNMLQHQQEETLPIKDNPPRPDSDHESGQSCRSASLGHKRKHDESHLRQRQEALPQQAAIPLRAVASEMPASESHDADHQFHNRPRESSPNQPDSLADRFVRSVRENTKIQGLNLTDEQYEEVKQHLRQMKERGKIDSDTCTKAQQKAYYSTAKRKAAQKEADKRYKSSNKGKALKKEVDNRYKSSNKGKAVDKRYRSSDKGKAAHKAADKRYRSKAAQKEAEERYRSSDKGKAALKEANKRYKNKLKDPSYNQQCLQKKIDRDTRKYRQAIDALEQQIRQYSPVISQETPELRHLHAQKQKLEEQWVNIQQGHDNALQKANALVEIYTQMRALVEASQSVSHQQELGQTPYQAQALEEDPHDDAFENHESFQQFCIEGQALLQSVFHQPEHAPIDPSAAQPSDWERLVNDYQKFDDQLEVYLAEFADPESLEQGNTLDF
jgi:hypothetical protein